MIKNFGNHAGFQDNGNDFHIPTQQLSVSFFHPEFYLMMMESLEMAQKIVPKSLKGSDREAKTRQNLNDGRSLA
jgi:hypothetical protein